jgi:hypothetical protein
VRVVQDEVSTEQDRDMIAEQKDPKGGDKDKQIAGEPAPESGGCGSGRRVGEYLSSRVKTKAKKRSHRRAGCRSPAFRRQGSERTSQRTKVLRKSESGRIERPPAWGESGTGTRSRTSCSEECEPSACGSLAVAGLGIRLTERRSRPEAPLPVGERADSQAGDMKPKPLLEVAGVDGSVQVHSQLFAGGVSLANFYRGGIEKSVGEGKSPQTEAWGSRK